jgi:hypothetical protein
LNVLRKLITTINREDEERRRKRKQHLLSQMQESSQEDHEKISNEDDEREWREVLLVHSLDVLNSTIQFIYFLLRLEIPHLPLQQLFPSSPNPLPASDVHVLIGVCRNLLRSLPDTVLTSTRLSSLLQHAYKACNARFLIVRHDEENEKLRRVSNEDEEPQKERIQKLQQFETGCFVGILLSLPEENVCILKLLGMCVYVCTRV